MCTQKHLLHQLYINEIFFKSNRFVVSCFVSKRTRQYNLRRHLRNFKQIAIGLLATASNDDNVEKKITETNVIFTTFSGIFYNFYKRNCAIPYQTPLTSTCLIPKRVMYNRFYDNLQRRVKR